MGKSQYYPPSAPELSENRLFGMFHASTLQHSKDVIMKCLQDCHGTVRASVAMGMGIDLHGVDTIIHYGAPSSIKLVVEEAKVDIQLTPESTGHLKIAKLVRIAKKSPPFMIREDRIGEVTVSAGTRSSSPTASSTRSSPVLKDAELICCCFLIVFYDFC